MDALTGAKQESGEGSALQKQFAGLPEGDYTFNVKSKKADYDDSDNAGVDFSIEEPAPKAPTNVKCADGSSRTQKIITWEAAAGGTEPDGYIYSVSGATTIG